MRKTAAKPDHEGGFTFIELVLAVAFLSTSMIAFISSMFSAQTLSQQSRTMHRANAAIIRQNETFQEQCELSFEDVVDTYQKGNVQITPPKKLGDNTWMKVEIILDETALTPAIDLNDDGDTTDRVVLPKDARAVVLKTTLGWTNSKGRKNKMVRHTIVKKPVGIEDKSYGQPSDTTKEVLSGGTTSSTADATQSSASTSTSQDTASGYDSQTKAGQ